MTEIVQEFIEAMNKAGVAPHDPSVVVADNTKRYYRLDGDKATHKKGSYCLEEDDGFGFGWFMSHRDGEVHSWHSKTKRTWTPEQKDAHAEKMAASKKAREQQRKDAADAAQAEGKEIWDKSSRTGTSPYLDRKGVSLKGVRYLDDVLIVPMWRDGVMVAVQQIMPDGFKLFLKGSDHIGAYFSIRGSDNTIAICEGVSTGATVAQATGWSVICAFNAGNMKPVARSIRKKYPDARIVIAADNDHTATNGKGELYNVGVEKAGQAAVAIGGAQVLYPAPSDGITDWNDLHLAEGIERVRGDLTAVPVLVPENDASDAEQWEPDYDVDVVDGGDPLDAINPLGYDHGIYVFFPRTTGQIEYLSATALSRFPNLCTLADIRFWDAMYPDTKTSEKCEYASADLISACHRKGIFKIENARGVGAWRDGGKYLVNCGDVIVGEGVRCFPPEYKGDAVYEADHSVIDLTAAPMSNKDSAAFYDLVKSLSWKRPQHAIFMCGWIVCAQIGGALRWRPHIVITGERGAGKSTVVDRIVKPAVGRVGIHIDGGSTEAGLRREIGLSSRPVIADEFESENARDRAEVEKILAYMRKASSGGVIVNANGRYIARSAFCLSAINPRIQQGADMVRITHLELVKNKSKNARADYLKFLKRLDDIMTDDFASRLMARTVANMDVLVDNIKVFENVAVEVLGDARSAEQIAPMVAGAYLLTSTQRVTEDFAREWMAGQDWSWNEGAGGQSDADVLISTIMSARLRYDHDGMGRESTIGELVWRAYHSGSMGHDDAIRGLGGAGIKVEGDTLLVSNTAPRLKTILNDTPWAVWKGTLGGYEGASNCDGRMIYFAPGVKSRATSIPIGSVLEMEEVDSDWEMEGFE